MTFFLTFFQNVHSREYSGHFSVDLNISKSNTFYIRSPFKVDQTKEVELPFYNNNTSPLKSKLTYVMKFILHDESNDQFNSTIEIYEKYYSDINNQYNFMKIITLDANGKLDTDNEYAIVSDSEPNLKVTLNIDKKFTLEEVKERFKTK